MNRPIPLREALERSSQEFALFASCASEELHGLQAIMARTVATVARLRQEGRSPDDLAELQRLLVQLERVLPQLVRVAGGIQASADRLVGFIEDAARSPTG